MNEGVAGMPDGALALFAQLVSPEDLNSYRRTLGRGGGGLFTPALTVWLSVSAYLYGTGSLESAWQACGREEIAALSPRSARGKRVLSPYPTGFAHARKALPQAVADRAADLLYEQGARALGVQGRPVFLLDGTSLRLPSTPSLLREFPPAVNQYGASHWPIARVVVAHELHTGLALRPEWGPMFGPEAMSEHGLGMRLMERIPDGALVIADRFFGAFSMAFRLGANLILRLKEQQARAILGKGADLLPEMDEPVVWKRGVSKDPACPKGSSIKGRLIVREVAHPGKGLMRLCLFTDDLKSSAEKLVELYALRWNVETDLRTVKRTVGLEVMRSQSPETLGKELVLAFSAYNLVRVVAGLAAYRAGIEPRRIGFTRAATAVRLFARRATRLPEEVEAFFESLAAKTLPVRPNRKHPPRAVWPRSSPYPVRTHKT